MSNRTIFFISAGFALINIAAALVNLYVIFFDTPDKFTWPNLLITNPVSLILAIAGMIYFRRG